MKTTTLKIFTGLALLVLAPTAALAHSNVSVNIGLGGGYYYPPEAVYVAPAPVYYETGPVYYGGPTAVYEYRYPQYRWGYRVEHHRWHDERRGEHNHGHRWHDDDDDD